MIAAADQSDDKQLRIDVNGTPAQLPRKPSHFLDTEGGATLNRAWGA
jgi:hypothetical protein